jgi:hypothetical protein
MAPQQAGAAMVQERTMANGSQRIFDRRRVDTAKVTLPWADNPEIT